jgi:DNA primase large subunit
MNDRSKKSATRQQVLIVNDLSGNTKSYKPATCSPFLSLNAIVANFDHLCRAGVNRAGTAAKARAVKQMLNAKC